MASGWANEGAVQQQIDATVEDAVERARRHLNDGPSLSHCLECGAAIPEARRQAVSGVRYCVRCQAAIDSFETSRSIYNRRASKNSQLR